MNNATNLPYGQISLRRFINEIADGPFGSSLTSGHYSNEGARVVRLGNIGSAHFRGEDQAYIPLEYFKELQRHEVRSGDLLIAGLGDENHPVGRACVAPSDIGPAIVKADCFRVRLDQSRLTHRYAAWALSSLLVTQQVSTLTRGSTRARINLEVAREIRIPVPPVAEQSRISNFLDLETSRLDRLAKAHQSQIALLRQRLAQLVDGVVAGDLDSLAKAGAEVEAGGWRSGRISRVCEVIPGYAFPSSGFLADGNGIRLLRGSNVGVGELVWDDVVSWDMESFPVSERFHLRPGDLIMGMDRPWISRGMRTAVVQDCDLPALLLQRVACLRRKSATVDMNFVRWVLRSTHFRLAVESEMTGVSVPHLSGEQIGSFSFLLPPPGDQARLAAILDENALRNRRLLAAMDQQIALLDERRQALITAAVTGQFDVSTASGRNVMDGVQP